MSWKTINTNQLYEIDEYGNIRNAETKKTIKSFLDKDGYLRAHLWNRTSKSYMNKQVHRLVLETFKGNAPINKPEVHHKDGNRQNNFIENLCWVSRQENDSHVKHIVNDGSYPPIKVQQLDLFDNVIAEFESMSEAARATGCHISKISCVCSGKRYTTGGYKWRKIEGSTTNSSAKPHETEGSSIEDEDIV